jgi:hypothetical protein
MYYIIVSFDFVGLFNLWRLLLIDIDSTLWRLLLIDIDSILDFRCLLLTLEHNLKFVVV